MTRPPRATADLPLAGVRVLDLTRMFAGPLGTQTLADLGADVIKIEEPRIGDPTRRNLPYVEDESLYNLSLNRGKRSVALNLKSADGAAVARRLARTSDIVAENFRPGVMTELGLGYADLARSNPGLVYCSLSGFGATGPLRARASFDLVNQAMSGVLSLTGAAGERPVRIGIPLGDVGGGLYLAACALAGLAIKRASGVGCYVDLSLHETLYSMLLDRAVPGAGERNGNRVAEHAPHGIYAAHDGYLAVVVTGDAGWRHLVDALDAAALRDERFASLAGRKRHEDELDALLTGMFGDQPVAATCGRLAGMAEVFAVPVRTLGEAIDARATSPDRLFTADPHPAFANLHNLRSPIRVDGRRLGDRPRAPRLGADTRAVLAEAGYSAAQITDLLAAGVGRQFGDEYRPVTR